MNNAQEELIQKINRMSLEELSSVYSTTVVTSRMITISGIFLIVIALMIANPIAYIVFALITGFLALVGVSADFARKAIKSRISSLSARADK